MMEVKDSNGEKTTKKNYDDTHTHNTHKVEPYKAKKQNNKKKL